jgi:hypothetical protein
VPTVNTVIISSVLRPECETVMVTGHCRALRQAAGWWLRNGPGRVRLPVAAATVVPGAVTGPDCTDSSMVPRLQRPGPGQSQPWKFPGSLSLRLMTHGN